MLEIKAVLTLHEGGRQSDPAGTSGYFLFWLVLDPDGVLLIFTYFGEFFELYTYSLAPFFVLCFKYVDGEVISMHAKIYALKNVFCDIENVNKNYFLLASNIQ